MNMIWTPINLQKIFLEMVKFVPDHIKTKKNV